jgi:GTPase
MTERSLPVVAVVGRPNVGKSSLVNRVLGRRAAIVEASPGVTRDRHSAVAQWSGRTFEVVDTGGLEAGGPDLQRRIGAQARVAIDLADVIVLVVDASVGVTEDDALVADGLRSSGKTVLLAANKVDDASGEAGVADLFRLGLGEPVPVSALHGRGSGDLLDALVDLLPAPTSTAAGPATSDAWAALAIVGRPNVGKSSLLNALVEEERALVATSPGTTRDPVDSFVSLHPGRTLRVVDTAGMRREVQLTDPLEYFAWLRSRQTLQRVDAAVLVVDAFEGVTGHDQRIAEEIVRAGRACVVCINKWDAAPSDERDRARLERSLRQRLRFVTWAPWVRTSAVTGRGVDALLPAVESAVGSHRRELPTAQVNRLIHGAQARRPHPRTGGRVIRILYSVQTGVSPPTFRLFTNGALEPGYVRYLENRLRAEEELVGTPVRLEVRRKSGSRAQG